MPANNPIVQGVHVSAFGGAPEAGGGGMPAPSKSGGGEGEVDVIHTPGAYRNPMVALMLFGLAILILFWIAGFKFYASASAGR